MLFTLLLLLLPPKHFDMRGIKYPLLQESKHCRNLEKVAPKSSHTAKKRAEPSKYHHPWESMRCDNLIVGGTFKKVVKEEEEKDYLLYWKGTCLHGGSLFSMKKHQAFAEKRTYSLWQKIWDSRNKTELSQHHGDIPK